MRLRTALPFALCAAAMTILSACSSSTAVTESEQKSFMDESAYELFKQVPNYYKTEYFALGIPEGWQVVTFNDQHLDSNISVQSQDRSAMVTIRVRSTQHSIEESCELAKNAYLANEANFIREPGVQFGTCIVEAEENGKSEILWLRNYDDDASSYSIAISGPMEKATEVLTYLIGNEKMMGLLVRPL